MSDTHKFDPKLMGDKINVVWYSEDGLGSKMDLLRLSWLVAVDTDKAIVYSPEEDRYAAIEVDEQGLFRTTYESDYNPDTPRLQKLFEVLENMLAYRET